MIKLLLLLSLALPLQTQSSDRNTERITEIRKLYDENRWEEIARLALPTREEPCDLDFYRGLALARLQRWEEAKAAFETGLAKDPRDKRFLVELAGVAYKQKNNARTKAYLKRALRLDPKDEYALDFLATVYFLDGNLEAALQTWNQIGKPRIMEVRFDPPLRIQAALLDRAFAFSPLSVLQLDEYRASEARVANLGIFSHEQFELRPAAGGAYTMTFRGDERNGWGDGKVGALISIFRGLPYQTIYPAYDNLHGSAINVDSLVRWDSQKRRFLAGISFPLEQDPKWRVRVYFDGRSENWDISRTLQATSSPITALKLEKEETGVEIRRVVSGRLSWQTAASFAHRTFRNFSGAAPSATALFTDGNSLKAGASLEYQLLRNVERRITLDPSVSGQIGRLFAASAGAFGKVEGSLALRWLPQARGNDYEVKSRIRAGSILGTAPFDEAYMLGIERDNDLWLRGTPGTRAGRKGSAPLGRNFVLWNWEMDKIVYRHPFFTVKVGPFLDAGRVSDSTGNFASQGWLWDPGAQCKVRVLGRFDVIFSYGRDTRVGRNAFYATAQR